MLACDESMAVRAYRQDRAMRAALSLLVIPFLMLLFSSVLQNNSQVVADWVMDAAQASMIGAWVFAVISGCALVIVCLFIFGVIGPKLGGITHRQYRQLLAQDKPRKAARPDAKMDLSDSSLRESIDRMPTLAHRQAQAFVLRHEMVSSGRKAPPWLDDLAAQVHATSPTPTQLKNSRRIALAEALIRVNGSTGRAISVDIQNLATGKNASGAYLDVHPKSLLTVPPERVRLVTQEG